MAVRARVDTAPPPSGPSRIMKSDYTFKDERLIEIGRENLHLLERLSAVASRRPGGAVVAAAVPAGPRVSTHTINRKRQATAIQKENMRLLAKLQTTKSTFTGAKPPPRLPRKPASSGPASVGSAAGAPAPLTERPAWVDVTAAPPVSAAWAAGAPASGRAKTSR